LKKLNVRDAVPGANVRHRLFFDQVQPENLDFFLGGKSFSFVLDSHFLSLKYTLIQIQEMSNSV